MYDFDPYIFLVKSVLSINKSADYGAPSSGDVHQWAKKVDLSK